MKDIDLVVMRLVDMHRVHPQMDRSHKCSKCGAPVGIYPSGQNVLRLQELGEARVTIICNACTQPGPDTRLAPGAEKEPAQSISVKKGSA